MSTHYDYDHEQPCAELYHKRTNAWWVGKLVRSVRELGNGNGRLPEGSLYHVERKYDGFKLLSLGCPCCGYRQYITGVGAKDLVLVHPEDHLKLQDQDLSLEQYTERLRELATHLGFKLPQVLDAQRLREAYQQDLAPFEVIAQLAEAVEQAAG